MTVTVMQSISTTSWSTEVAAICTILAWSMLKKLQKEFNYYEKNGFLHCIYKRSGANYVVVSYPLSSWIDKEKGFQHFSFLSTFWVFADST